MSNDTIIVAKGYTAGKSVVLQMRCPPGMSMEAGTVDVVILGHTIQMVRGDKSEAQNACGCCGSVVVHSPDRCAWCGDLLVDLTTRLLCSTCTAYNSAVIENSGRAVLKQLRKSINDEHGPSAVSLAPPVKAPVLLAVDDPNGDDVA